MFTFRRVAEDVPVPSLWLIAVVILGLVLVINVVLILPGVVNFLRTRNFPRRRD
jgi:hypothetical protein